MILGLNDYHCGLHGLEVPVSNSCTQLHQCAYPFATHIGSKCGGGWKAQDWCELGTLSRELTGIFSKNALVNTPVTNKEEVVGDRSILCLDTEGIALHIDLPCSPCDDSDSAELTCVKSHEQFLAIAQAKGGIAGPALQKGSHELLKMTSQAEAPQRFFATWKADYANRFQRWRKVTCIDQRPESAPYVLKKPEILPSFKMSTTPVKEGLVESVSGGRDKKAGLAAESDFMKDSAVDQHRNCSQGESPCSIVESSESKTPLNLGSHGLRALVETDNVQKLKRRRLTLPTLNDSATVKHSKDISGSNSPDYVCRQRRELLVPKGIERPEESLVSPVSDGLPIIRSSTESETAQDAMDITESGDCTSEMVSSGKGKSDSRSDSTSGSQDNSPLDKYISRPSRLSGGSTDVIGSKKKEWLGGQHHHGGNGKEEKIGSAQDVGFAGNVGRCYRSAIDKRPAAPHPGFVGDGAAVQFCKICGGREDATSSLICDSCEEVFHMACVNARMKIVPRVDEWLCRPCKKKRNMSKENDQGDSDTGGDPKDWWKGDSGIGRVERELLRMSNGRRMKVRLGPKYQADVPEWTGIADEVDLYDNLAETSYRFGQEVVQSDEQKKLEKEMAVHNLANNIWPRGWLPATQLPSGSKENWVQCTLVLYDEGEICPDGHAAEKEIKCEKWRRAPLGVGPNDEGEWECSCALEWDPRHSDCAVPQELSTEEITERIKPTRLIMQQGSKHNET